MAKTFREWHVEQRWLLPPSVQELVGPNDPAHFIRELCRTTLDLSAILSTYSEERGYPPYHPVMMTALLMHAYTQGIRSARGIARACQTRVDFMAVTGMQQPDFRTVSDFRKRHLESLGGLFVQVLRLCQRAGMVKLAHVALDGTKVQANASKHKAMSYERMKRTEKELAADVARWFAEADAEDEAEDRAYGPDKSGDELPEWVANKEQRLERIRAAMQELKAEAKAQLAAGVKPEDPDDPNKPGGGKRSRKAPNKNGEPNDKAQLNFTDSDSSILKTGNGFVQGYNCQLAVDAKEQVIVAHSVGNEQNDAQQLAPMVKLVKRNTGRQAKELSADAGYLSEGNLKECARRHVAAYIATGRQKHGSKTATRLGAPGTRMHAMKRKLQRAGHRSRYRLRKQVVEPVIGQIKEARGFRRFHLRGLRKVPHEWALVCTAHNLLKLARRAGKTNAA